MKVKMSVEDLNKELVTLKMLFDNGAIPEDQKNLIFWASKDGFKVIARNSSIDCICSVKAEVEAELDEMVHVRYKELDTVLNAFKSLSMTKATDISFDFLERAINVVVFEEPIDTEYEFADKLYRQNRFTLSLVRAVTDSVKKELLDVSFSDEGTPVNGEDILKYFNALIPTVRDVKQAGVATRFNVVGEYMYTTPQQFVAVMRNDIKEFADFILTKASAEFVRVFFSNEPVTNVYIQENSNGSKMIRLTNGGSCALVKAQGVANAFDITRYVDMPKDGVVVDKKYFCDVLRRLTDSKEAVKFIITPDEIVLRQSRAELAVPVIMNRLPDGFDKVSISIALATLQNIVFAHFIAGDKLFVYFTEGNNNKLDVTFTDDSQTADGSHLWWTKAAYRKNSI